MFKVDINIYNMSKKNVNPFLMMDFLEHFKEKNPNILILYENVEL